MPLFATIVSGESETALLAQTALQRWIQNLEPVEYAVFEENLAEEPFFADRPMVTRANAVMERIRQIYAQPGETWTLKVVRGLA